MNCRPGDLAFHMGGVDGAKSRNLGKVIKVLKARMAQFRGPDGKVETYLAWTYEGAPIIGWNGKVCAFVEDMCLRPIRDQDGEDEILRIAGKPQEVM